MTHFFIDIQDLSFDKRVKYIFNFIENHPLNNGVASFSFSEEKQNRISYGTKPTGTFHIPAQKLIFTNTPITPTSFISNKYAFNELQLFSVENKQRIENRFIIENTFSFDIIETIFFHISRLEEHIIRPDMKKNWGLGEKENHFIPRNNLQEIPIVDHLVFAFLMAIGANPLKRKTNYRLTHDVDITLKLPNIYKLIKASGRLLLIERKGIKAQIELFKLYAKIRKGIIKDPYDTFDWLFRLEEIEKVIYFMAGGITKYDNFYRIDSPIARRTIKQAQSKGYKIGLHPSYEAYANEELYTKEKKALEQVLGEKVELARQHYLRFQFPETADIIDSQGITEDSTLGYRDMIGFRSGTGFGYRLYNFAKEEAYQFVEVPLVIMEWSLLVQNNHDVQEANKALNMFLEKNQYFTKVTILFHNSIFDQVGTQRKDLKTLYMNFIDYSTEKKS